MHKVEWWRRGRMKQWEFETAHDAYLFWLYLGRGVYAKLYQNGELVAAGNGLESN